MSALLGFPQMIPSFLGFFVRQFPDWAADNILVGAVVSYLIAVVLQPAPLQKTGSLIDALEMTRE